MPVIVANPGARRPAGPPANRSRSHPALRIDDQFRTCSRRRGAIEPNETARGKGPTRDPAIEKAGTSDIHQSVLSLRAAWPEGASIVVQCSARHSGAAAVDKEIGDQRRGEI
jgi:hypothetical protein